MPFAVPSIESGVPTQEVFVFVALFAVLFAVAYWFGSVRVIAIALSTFVAQTLSARIFDAALVGTLAQSVTKYHYGPGILFFVLLVFSYLILGRMIGADNAPVHKPLDALLASIAGTGFFAIFWSSTGSLVALWQPAASVAHYFSAPYVFWWFTATLIGLSISRSRGFF
jgi:hypothetical protein